MQTGKRIGMLGAAVLAASALAGMTSVNTDGPAMRIMKSADGSAAHGTTLANQSSKKGQSNSDFARGAWLRLRGTRQRRAAYGWTNMHQKRVARKARNVKRSRRK